MMETMRKDVPEKMLKRFESMLGSGPVIFIQWHSHKSSGKIDYISSNITRMGYRFQDFEEGKISLSDIIFNEDFISLTSRIDLTETDLLENKSILGTLRILHANNNSNRIFQYFIVLPSLKNENAFYLGYFLDLEDLHNAKQEYIKFEYQAYHDSLTGLPNRNLLNDRLGLEIHRSERNKLKLGIMFLDLDNFKNINDTLGHLMGDKLLKEASVRLLKSIRNGDTASRIGGDEFTVLLPDLSDPKEIVVVAQRILRVFKEPFLIEEFELYCTISIGITIFPTDGKDQTELLKNADLAMYHAKNLGKNNYVFFSRGLDLQVKQRLETENLLWHSLRENRFILHYQPIVNLKTGNIIGIEALVRWQKSDSGLIPPMEFIPLAEETGLILELGQWVIESACNQSMKWKEQGIHSLYISINISSRQFSRNDFLACVKKLLKKTGIATHAINFQVTENGLLGFGESGKIIRILRDLRKLGIKLSIDDFGMGFSSLNSIREYPIDTLKIDRTFIKGIPHDSSCAAITRSIIGLSKNLGIHSLAEGVETEAQLDFLVNNQCDLMQGFLFSPPLPEPEITQLLMDKKNLYN